MELISDSFSISIQNLLFFSCTNRTKYTGHSVQLTATKQTRFRRMQLDENILDNIYEPREV